MKLKILAGITAGLMATTSPVWADITAQDYLDLLRNMMAKSGQELVIGSQEMVGDTLILRDFKQIIPADKVNITVSTEWLKVREIDGTLEITSSPQTILQADAKPKEGLEFSITGIVSQVGYLELASGSPEKITFEIFFDSVRFDLGRIASGSMVLEPIFNFALDDISGNYTVFQNGGDIRVDGQVDVGQTTSNLNFLIPGGTDFVTAYYEVNDIGVTAQGDVLDIAALEATVAQGQNPLQMMDFAYEISTGASVVDVKFKVDGENGALDWKQDAFSGGLTINPDVMAFGFSYLGGVINVAASDLPFPPVEVKFTEISMDIQVPLALSDTPSDVGMQIALREVEVSDFLWSMFDPGKSLPRNPVSAAIDLTGTVDILVDVMDLASLTQMNGPPALPLSLNLNELLVSAAGAELTGSGSVIFNNDNTELFDGIPQPIGSVDLSLRGGFGLLDKLTALGLVPHEASFGIRAMLGGFAKPGDEADHFTSTIEMTEDGAILANGQRIK